MPLHGVDCFSSSSASSSLRRRRRSRSFNFFNLTTSSSPLLSVFSRLHMVELEHADSDTQSCDSETIFPAIQTACEQLDPAVSRCSVQLVKQSCGEQILHSPVIEFCAFCVMTEHGNWVPAVSFTPFFTAVIHCMQHWLLCHCFNRPLPAAQEPGNDCALDSLIREVYAHYLVNTSWGPVAELSYCRRYHLSNHDGQPRPGRRPSPPCSLRLEDWRPDLQALLAQTTELLEDRLPLGLHAAPR
jgi:hypothetical protein